MPLSPMTLRWLALMVCGQKTEKHCKSFPYRSGGALTQFFMNCNIGDLHDGSSRVPWVQEVLTKHNRMASSHPDVPSDELVLVIEGLLDPDYYDVRNEDNREIAFVELNEILARDHLSVFLDESGRAHLKHDTTGAVAVRGNQSRPLSREETAHRAKVEQYLDAASEDDFTKYVLLPLFEQLGFKRVNVAGHKEKILEFGKDLWMKFHLPTGHHLYFAAQIKIGKIDARGVSDGNVAELYNQAIMAMSHPIIDFDVNRKVLIDHVFLISGGEITKQAREWIAGKLDNDQRRQIIFMDRKELLDHAARIVANLPASNPLKAKSGGLPF